MKKQNEELQLTQVQAEIIAACEPMIKEAVRREKERVQKMCVGAAEWCTAKAQERFNKLVPTVEEFQRHRYSVVDRDCSMWHLLYEYKTKVLNLKRESEMYKTFDNCFNSTHNIRSYGDLTIPKLTFENKEEYKIFTSQELFDKAIGQYEVYYKNLMSAKLVRSLLKYVITKYTKVKDIIIEKGVEGFELKCILIDEVSHVMYTRAIDAGGYNIQCFHYRYITKIK